MNVLSIFLWDSPPSDYTWIMNMVLIGVAMVVIYFLMIRPQSQQKKKQANFSSSLKKGKKIVTIGGLHGVIAEINETTVELIIAPKTHITIQRDAISMEFTNAAYGQQPETTSTEKQTEESK